MSEIYKVVFRGKLKCILTHLSRQTSIDLSKLGVIPVKTKKQFLDNYNLHDKATAYIALKYFQNNFSLHPIGKDLREYRVMILNEVPDYYVEKLIDIESIENSNCFCFDVKSKRKIKYFGWVNERAVHGYKILAKKCKIPIYLIFILIENGNPTETFGYCDLSISPKERRTAWDKNKVLIYDWKVGLPFLPTITSTISNF